ncbi:sucrose transport protein, putative [Talaromyces stipitatus ATCC 10500]|uniref:Sucrose transport protein, putative n=1 Tax=Talaromyces stipitatus (strain ATCC 10500 / CBS 375.48 / QM 6759 / NRRL 1006) TaxID=441959 RepID=B8M4F1_TALSN|nr:sucrose transport protein, putative [Talaromyces stipitatus ATCC 10500]EED19146.1 sucrose transport protein, putative [Talaromyces stipitatus ATCC 10500]
MNKVVGGRRSYPCLTTIGFEGLQVAFSLFSGQVVTHLTSLGLRPAQIAITLLFGPICGAIFQPYFGSWSDRCQSPWGRRRPFIVIGTGFLIISMLCLAWVDSITLGILLRSSNAAYETAYRTVLVILAMIFTFTTYVSIQAVQVGLRALVTDDSTPLQQAEANVWAGRHVNLAAALGYFAAYVNLPRYIRYFGKTTFAGTSVLTAVYLAITITITCFCDSDEPYIVEKGSASGHGETFRVMRDVFFGTSKQVRLILLVQFLAWFGWFPFLFYTVTYVDSLQKANSAGYKNMGALAPLVYSIVALLIAIVLPSQTLSTRDSTATLGRGPLSWYRIIITPRNLWIASHGVFTIAMLGTFFVRSALGTVLLFSLVGFTWAISSRIPYSLLGDELSRSYSRDNDDDGDEEEDSFTTRQGLIHGIHNIAICLPQIIIMLVMGLFWVITEKKTASHDETVEHQKFLGIVWFLRLGGLFSLGAMYYTTKLRQWDHNRVGGIDCKITIYSSKEKEIEHRLSQVQLKHSDFVSGAQKGHKHTQHCYMVP